MKAHIGPAIKAHLIRDAFYLLLLLAILVIPFALGQRSATNSTSDTGKMSLGVGLSPTSGYATAAATPAYPLHPSGDGRYVVDSNNVPFLIIGDSPHSILANLSNADATTYLTDRGQRGFNALWIELLCDSYTFGYGDEGTPHYGKDANGDDPFTATLAGGYYDLTAPNEAYWSHVDFIVQTAAANGLQCLFTPLDQGGWCQTSITNGVARCTQYGQFLGNRYRNSPNIIWNLGNDFQNWRNQQYEAPILAIVDGIRSTDPNHLITIELDYPVSESQDDANFIPRINTNGVYTYYPTYAETYVAYNKPTIMPVLFLEENYENEANQGELGTPFVLRHQEYWSLTAGALAGHMYGSYWIDRFDPAWQQHLSSQCVTELGYFKNFFTSINFQALEPDQSHSLLTAGYGTYDDSNVHLSQVDYATAAKSSDGSLAVIYTPVAHTLTVALGNFSGLVTAKWFDPTNATLQTVAGSPFPNQGSHNFTTPGDNSRGDPDWVLLLQAEAGGTPTPTPTGCTVTSTACGSIVVGTASTDFTVNLSDPADPATVQGNDFTVNGIPANTAILSNNNTTITFHFNSSPVVQGQNTMHIPAGAFNCVNGPVQEFTCTFTYQASTPTPTQPPPSPTATATPTATPTLTPRPSPTPRVAPTPRVRPTPPPRP